MSTQQPIPRDLPSRTARIRPGSSFALTAWGGAPAAHCGGGMGFDRQVGPHRSLRESGVARRFARILGDRADQAEFRRAATVGEEDKSFLSARNEYRVDCAQRRLAYREMEAYAELDLQGDPVQKTRIGEKNLKWMDAPTGTVFGAIVDYACKNVPAGLPPAHEIGLSPWPGCKALATRTLSRMRHREFKAAGIGGIDLYAQGWLPGTAPRAVIVVSHGLAEHGGRYETLAGELVQRDYAVYAIDHRGHGRSSGPRANIDRFAHLVSDFCAFTDRCAREHLDTPVFMLGHSMGGAVAFASALRLQHTLRGLVLSAPALATDQKVPPLQEMFVRFLSVVAPNTGALTLPANAVSRDPSVVARYEADPLVHHKAIPARTLVELLGAMQGFPPARPNSACPRWSCTAPRTRWCRSRRPGRSTRRSARATASSSSTTASTTRSSTSPSVKE